MVDDNSRDRGTSIDADNHGGIGPSHFPAMTPRRAVRSRVSVRKRLIASTAACSPSAAMNAVKPHRSKNANARSTDSIALATSRGDSFLRVHMRRGTFDPTFATPQERIIEWRGSGRVVWGTRWCRHRRHTSRVEAVSGLAECGDCYGKQHDALHCRVQRQGDGLE